MNKVLVVARTEYLIAITSKAFLLGIFLMPIFMGGAFLVQYLTKDQVDLRPRKLAVVDYSGKLFEALSRRAEQWNESGVYSSDGDSGPPKQIQSKFLLEQITPTSGDQQRIDVILSERVKDDEIFAFAIIDSGIFDASSDASVRYFSETPSYQTLPTWLRQTINSEVKEKRIQELGIAQESVLALSSEIPLKKLGLVEVKETGDVEEAKEENRLLTFAVPFGGTMLMFMMIMSVAPAMLNNVLEEKMQKISEFLVSSITPFQLMLGKLLGAIGVGLTLAAVYLSAVYAMVIYYGYQDLVPPTMILWFVFFLLIALTIFGSIFSAIGAACSEIRDSQSLMTPVMLLVIIPMMCFAPIMDSPSSFFSKSVSLFPPATPMIMFMRIAIPPGPAIWEIVVGGILAALFALACVWAAGRVFRIGVLSSGQAPTFAQLATWIFRNN
jgi:ABC-2 type transport system permease protein